MFLLTCIFIEFLEGLSILKIQGTYTLPNRVVSSWHNHAVAEDANDWHGKDRFQSRGSIQIIE